MWGEEGARKGKEDEQHSPRAEESSSREDGCIPGEEKAGPGQEQNGNIPDEFYDPITLEIMNDPVIALDGHTYERSSIAQWLADHNVSPMTGSVLEAKTLFPNHNLRSQIRALSPSSGGDDDSVSFSPIIFGCRDCGDNAGKGNHKDVEDALLANQCEMHLRGLDMYCSHENKPICCLCLLEYPHSQHSSRDHISMSEQALQCEDRLKKTRESLQLEILDLKKKRDDMSASLHQLDEWNEEIMGKVLSMISGLHEVIEKTKKRLLENVEIKFKSRQQKLTSQCGAMLERSDPKGCCGESRSIQLIQANRKFLNVLDDIRQMKARLDVKDIHEGLSVPDLAPKTSAVVESLNALEYTVSAKISNRGAEDVAMIPGESPKNFALSLVSSSACTIELSWSIPDSADIVSISLMGWRPMEAKRQLYRGLKRGHVVSGLESGKSYKFQIEAETRSGHVLKSPESVFFTLEKLFPVLPGGFKLCSASELILETNDEQYLVPFSSPIAFGSTYVEVVILHNPGNSPFSIGIVDHTLLGGSYVVGRMDYFVGLAWDISLASSSMRPLRENDRLGILVDITTKLLKFFLNRLPLGNEIDISTATVVQCVIGMTSVGQKVSIDTAAKCPPLSQKRPSF